jgi:hypothetical protein
MLVMNVENTKNQDSSAIIPKILGSFCIISQDYFAKDIYNEARFGRLKLEYIRTLVTVRKSNRTSLWELPSDK